MYAIVCPCRKFCADFFTFLHTLAMATAPDTVLSTADGITRHYLNLLKPTGNFTY